jgi:hypothetical protein
MINYLRYSLLGINHNKTKFLYINIIFSCYNFIVIYRLCFMKEKSFITAATIELGKYIYYTKLMISKSSFFFIIILNLCKKKNNIR